MDFLEMLQHALRGDPEFRAFARDPDSRPDVQRAGHRVMLPPTPPAPNPRGDLPPLAPMVSQRMRWPLPHEEPAPFPFVERVPDVQHVRPPRAGSPELYDNPIDYAAAPFRRPADPRAEAAGILRPEPIDREPWRQPVDPLREVTADGRPIRRNQTLMRMDGSVEELNRPRGSTDGYLAPGSVAPERGVEPPSAPAVDYAEMDNQAWASALERTRSQMAAEQLERNRRIPRPRYPLIAQAWADPPGYKPDKLRRNDKIARKDEGSRPGQGFLMQPRELAQQQQDWMRGTSQPTARTDPDTGWPLDPITGQPVAPQEWERRMAAEERQRQEDAARTERRNQWGVSDSGITFRRRF